MAQIIVTFSAASEDDKTLKKIEKIAKDEKRSRSFVIVQALKDYIKKQNGNHDLDGLQKNPNGYPDPWLPIGEKELEPFGELELEDMIKKLDSAIANIRLDQRRKHEKKYLEKTGGRYSKSVVTSAAPR